MAALPNHHPRKRVTTADGSHTLFVPALNEHYHSTHGAVQESRYVYVEHGLKAHPATEALTVFELGFGTGLNALLASEYAQANGLALEFFSVEKYPLPVDEAATLDYMKEVRGLPAGAFTRLHHAAWNTLEQVDENILLHKLLGDMESVALPPAYFDVLFHDAFAPQLQPSLWTQAMFEKLWAAAKPEAVWVTYCAQGQMRRNMQAAGWKVERLPGPPGKRHMMRARKP